MSGARIAVLLLAILAAAAAAWLASSFVASDAPRQQAAPVQTIETEHVLVAARDISVGERVDAAALRWQEWPRAAVTSAYVVRARAPEAEAEFAETLARSPLLAGEPVTRNKLVTADSAGFMAARLGPGMRAVAVKISPETGAGGFILPGDRVDVILAREQRGDRTGEADASADTILTNVRVLAIGQAIEEASEDGEKTAMGKTATLELKLSQAEQLERAQAMGTIALALRSLSDVAGSGPADTGALDGRAAAGDGRARAGTVAVVRYGVRAQESPGGSR